mmetsp:Transcript_6954/g.13897  ORF Transcript_6954/g.13897 Transcript_6954/m.13897 type:complete len:301 (-) Transcript_6954:11-913(-)
MHSSSSSQDSKATTDIKDLDITTESNGDGKASGHLTTQANIPENIVKSALELKEICKKENLALRNDFEALRLATACRGDFGKMKKRIINLREFEAHHKLEELSPEETWDYYHNELPGGFMSFIGKDRSGRAVMYADTANFYPSKIFKDEKLKRVMFRQFSLLMQASATHPGEVDQGFIIVMNCKGMAMKNVSITLQQEVAWLLQSGYPIRLCQVVFFNANSITRWTLKACKVFLTRKMQDRIAIINGTEAIQELISAESLPESQQLGTQPTAQVRTTHLERVKAFYDFEPTFTLPKSSAA